MDEKNHHLHKSVFIGEIKADGQFNVVWKTPGPVKAKPWSPYIEGNDKKPDEPAKSKKLLRDPIWALQCSPYASTAPRFKPHLGPLATLLPFFRAPPWRGALAAKTLRSGWGTVLAW